MKVVVLPLKSVLALRLPMASYDEVSTIPRGRALRTLWFRVSYWNEVTWLFASVMLSKLPAGS